MSAETASGPTEDQVEILEYNFNKVNKHPDPTTLCLIAAEAGLTEEETQVSPQA
ncbi:Homeodomain-only protein [Cricetulus griseus]|uniref:Homeodomain-only protein n=1 Tax=Cricetulus griseus TaxID=10029 RepID=G3IL31_CRIGR|nr:Homeodomain-only protein [Cricetulus griseus]